MMPKLTNLILLPALLAITAATQAGSPDGLSVAAIASDTALSYTGSVQQFFLDYKRDGVKCGKYGLRLENVFTTNLPQQLTSDLAFGATRDKAKRKKLGKILTGFQDAKLDHGFDAVLAYEVKGGQLRLYGISGDASENVVVSTLSVSEAKDQKKFNIAACKAISSLPVLAEP